MSTTVRRRQILRLACGLALLLALCSPANAIDAAWLSPNDGDWANPIRWSTDPQFPDNGVLGTTGPYDAIIDAAGGPYTVALDQNVTVDSVTIDSPDATLRVANFARLSTNGGVHIEQGTLLLDDGAILINARLSAGQGGRAVSGANRSVRLANVELATTFEAYNCLQIDDTLQFDEGLLRFAAGDLFTAAHLQGAGEWQLQSARAESFDFQYRIYFYEPAGQELLIGPGVTVRSMGESVVLVRGIAFTPEMIGTVVNQGQILAETSGGSFFIGHFRNDGLVRIANGDSFSAGYRGNVGEVELLSGGSLTVTGAPHFNLPLTVGEGAELNLRTDEQATTVEPIALAPGGVIRLESPGSIVPIDSTGGTVQLFPVSPHPPFTATQLTTLPLTGPAQVVFAGLNGGLDLEQGVFDYTSLPPNYQFNPAFITNGTLTGPQSPQDASYRLIDAALDIPLDLQAAQVRLEGASTLVAPTQISGGQLLLFNDWSNATGIAVSEGLLQLFSPGMTPGEIDMSGGSLRITHSTTLTALESFSFGAPETIEIGDGPNGHENGLLDLQGRTLDLDAWPDSQWEVTRNGVIQNGAIVGTHDGAVLTAVTFGRAIRNSTVDNVKFVRGSMSDSTATNVWSTGPLSLDNTTLIDSRVDGDVGGDFTVQGELEANGAVRGRVQFAAGASLVGTPVLGGSTGRGQRDVYSFSDTQVTLPAEISLASATPFDSRATIDAPATALIIEGGVVVGYETSVRDSWTDSWTFQVANLHTKGDVEVTEDGILIVSGGHWTNSGQLQVTGGELQFDELTVASTGSLSGWGDATGGVLVEGSLISESQFQFAGSLGLESSSTTQIKLTPLTEPAPSEGEPAWIAVDGDLELAGALTVELTSDFLAQTFAVGDQYRLLDATNATGQFDAFSWNDAAFEFSLVYAANAVLMEVADLNDLPGDFNFDGAVNSTDVAQWEDSFGNSADADADFDGDSDGADFLLSQRYHGTTFLGPIATHGVPEPRSAELSALVGFVVVLLLKHKGRVRFAILPPLPAGQ